MTLHRAPFLLLLVAVCAAPLPYGSVHPGAWSALVLACGLAIAGWAIAVAVTGLPALRGRALLAPMAAFAVVIGWAAVQLSPDSPASWHHPIWAIASDALKEPLAGRITIDAEAGWCALTRLAAWGIIFWLAYQYGADAKLAKRALGVFAIAGAAVAGLGLFVWAAGLPAFLWFDEAFLSNNFRYGGRLALPFYNPNHLAAFSVIGLICSVGLIVGESTNLWRPETALREKLRRFTDVVVSRHWGLMVSALVHAAAVLLTQSRGGIAALLLGLLVLWAALMPRQSRIGSRVITACILGLLSVGLLLAPTILRFMDRVDAADEAAIIRLEVYRTTMSVIETSPLLGYGLGTFPSIYRIHDQDDLTAVVEFAHNTVLETTVELGIPAALALGLALAWPAAGCWRGARNRRRDRHIPAISAASAVALAFHSMVDFPLQIPAIAAAFAFVIGIGYAQAAGSGRRRSVTPS